MYQGNIDPSALVEAFYDMIDHLGNQDYVIDKQQLVNDAREMFESLVMYQS